MNRKLKAIIQQSFSDKKLKCIVIHKLLANCLIRVCGLKQQVTVDNRLETRLRVFFLENLLILNVFKRLIVSRM